MNLQATASAADLSSPRCFDDKMLEPAAPIETFVRFQAGFLSSQDFHGFLSIFINLHGFSLILKDFHDFGVWVLKGLKIGPVAPVETFARFQVGFLSSEDFHCFLWIFMDFHEFSYILMNFHDFGVWVLKLLKVGPAAL